MPNVENLDFLNANTIRNFPIREGLSRTDTSGAFTIPDDFMVDLLLSVSSDPATRVYISRIVNMPDEIEIEFALYGSATQIGVVSLNPAGHSRYTTYYMAASNNYAAATGKLVVGEISTITTLPYGTFTFDQTTTEVEARTVVPGLATVSRFVFRNADGTSFSVTGDVTIDQHQVSAGGFSYGGSRCRRWSGLECSLRR